MQIAMLSVYICSMPNGETLTYSPHPGEHPVCVYMNEEVATFVPVLLSVCVCLPACQLLILAQDMLRWLKWNVYQAS